MTVLTIAQNAAKRAGFTPPASLVGNSDDTAVQLLAIIEEETRALSDRFRWQALVKRATFDFVNGQETYDLPDDFKDYIQKTIWDYSSRRPLIAPISPEGYEIQKNYLITSGIDKMVYIYDGKIRVTPTPGSNDTINYEYTTLNIYKDENGVGKPEITADTDTTTIREFLVALGVKFRFLMAKGIIPSERYEHSFEHKDYIAQVSRAVLTDGFGQPNPINMSSGGNAYWMAAYTQDSNFPAV